MRAVLSMTAAEAYATTPQLRESGAVVFGDLRSLPEVANPRGFALELLILWPRTLAPANVSMLQEHLHSLRSKT